MVTDIIKPTTPRNFPRNSEVNLGTSSVPGGSQPSEPTGDRPSFNPARPSPDNSQSGGATGATPPVGNHPADKNRPEQSAPPKKRWWHDLICIAAIIAVAIIIVWPSLSHTLTEEDTLAPGADVGSHVYIAKYLTDYFTSHGKLPAVNPYWYSGWEAYHNTPKTMSIPLGIAYWLSGNILKVSQVGQVVVIIFAGLAMYGVIRKKHPALSALLGAVLFAFGPAFLFDIVYLGSYPRSTALAVAPLCLYFLEKVLNREKTARSLAWCALFLTFSILTHPLVGATLLLFFSIYVIIRIFTAKKYPHFKFTSLMLWLSIAGLALGASFFYLAPIFFEKIGWYQLPETLSLANSIPLPDLFVRMGLPLIIFLIIFVCQKKKAPGSWALFITGLIATLFGLGDYGPVYPLFRAANIYPFLGTMFGAFAFAYVIAINLPIQWSFRPRTKNASLIIALIIVIAFLGWRGFTDTYGMKISQAQFLQPKDQELLQIMAKYDQPGRLMPMKYPFGFLLWWLTVGEKTPLYEGWYYSTTLQGKHIAWIYDAINHGFPDYALKRFEQLQVRYLLATRNFYNHMRDANLVFLERAKEKGFEEVAVIKGEEYAEPAYALHIQDKPVSFISPVQENVLVIGQHAMPAVAILPGAIQGSSINLDDYDLEFLEKFDTILLIGFTFNNKERAEALVTELSRQEKKIVIDMNGAVGSRLEENLTFLGVTAYPEIYHQSVRLETTDSLAAAGLVFPSQMKIPGEVNENFDFTRPESDNNPRTIDLKDWRFTSYLNLDEICVRLDKGGDDFFGAVGYKNVAGNKVWFVGPNIFYHYYLTKDATEGNFINTLIPTTTRELPAVDVQQADLQPEEGSLKFNFTSDGPWLGLVSYTYSPHWQAYLDGQPVKIDNLEDLMILDLPAGEHALEIRYADIPLHDIGSAISLVFVSGLVVLIIWGSLPRRRPIKPELKNEDFNYQSTWVSRH